MSEASPQLIWFLAMLCILPLVYRSRDNLSAWGVILASCLSGILAADKITGASLLIAYAMIDGVTGIIVQRLSPHRPFTLMGVAYGMMGLSHITLHFHWMLPATHDFVGNVAGWALFFILTFMGIWDGGHRNRNHSLNTVRGRAAHAGTSEKKAS